jgi:hypothetical protein
MLLEALVVADPENQMISKLVKNLLSMRRNGIWQNTQENCWALIALDRYFTGTSFLSAVQRSCVMTAATTTRPTT